MRTPLGEQPFWVIKSMMLYIPLKIVPGSQIEKSGSQLAPEKGGQLGALCCTYFGLAIVMDVLENKQGAISKW